MLKLCGGRCSVVIIIRLREIFIIRERVLDVVASLYLRSQRVASFARVAVRGIGKYDIQAVHNCGDYAGVASGEC